MQLLFTHQNKNSFSFVYLTAVEILFLFHLQMSFFMLEQPLISLAKTLLLHVLWALLMITITSELTFLSITGLLVRS